MSIIVSPHLVEVFISSGRAASVVVSTVQKSKRILTIRNATLTIYKGRNRIEEYSGDLRVIVKPEPGKQF